MHHYFDIIKNHNTSHTSVAEWLVAISTTLVVILAVWGEKFKHWINKPKLIFLKIKITEQDLGEQIITMYRLILKNTKSNAKNLKAFVYSNSNVNQKRFFSIPLNWTHIDGRKRDVSHGEEAYLDLFHKEHKGEKDIYKWHWPHGKTPYEPALSELSPEGKSIIKICFYDEYSFLDSVKIEFDPKNPDKIVIL